MFGDRMDHSTYEAVDGGVYVETEAMELSRDIPAARRWMVGPIVRRVAGLRSVYGGAKSAR